MEITGGFGLNSIPRCLASHSSTFSTWHKAYNPSAVLLVDAFNIYKGPKPRGPTLVSVVCEDNL
jgi:hypothetical protein